jgi:hypothetical protein
VIAERQRQLPSPLHFHGKAILVTPQVWVPQGLVPKALAALAAPFAPGQDHLVAVLIHHFDRCFVEMLVRIVEKPDRRWGVTNREMDQPNTTPWFLICACKDAAVLKEGRMILYFLVNDNYEFYPLVVPEQDKWSHLVDCKHIYLLAESRYTTGDFGWIEFSEIDRLMVEAAIQAFLRKESWTT